MSFDPQPVGVAAKGAGKGGAASDRGKGWDPRWVDPLSIEFSQPGINPNKFSDGRSVEDLIVALETGATRPEDVPWIRVFERHDGTLPGARRCAEKPDRLDRSDSSLPRAW